MLGPGRYRADMKRATGMGDGSVEGVSLRTRRRIATGLLLVSLVIVAYWAAWALDRPLVASSTGHAYVVFEDAFPAADFFLVACLLLAAWALVTRRPTALLWMLLGSGGGFYLLGMDVLYDLQHGVWGEGANGLVELAINILTLVVSVAVGSWAWRHRDDLVQPG